MPTNIVDALVTTLSLDNANFLKGIKQSTEAQKKYRESAVDDAERQQIAQKAVGEGIRKIRNETLGLFLAMGGARSVNEFFKTIVQGDAATGRLAENIGMATENVSAWEQAITRVGGSAASADDTLKALTTTVQNARLGQIDPQKLAAYQGLGVTRFDDPEQMMLQMARASERMTKPEFNARAGFAGINPDTIQLLELGEKRVRELLKAAHEHGVTTKADADAAREFDSALADLATTIKGDARPAVEGIVKPLTAMLKDTDALNIAIPVMVGVVGALGVAALIAAGPFAALAVAIGAAVLAYERLSTHSGLARIMENLAGDKRAFAALMHGDFKGAWNEIRNTDHSASDAMAAKERGGSTPQVTGGSSGSFFDRIVNQESRGRAGVTGPMTPYGQAHGLSQMLDGTAQMMARKLGIAWRPDLMRSKTQEGADYQRKLGMAYAQEGLRRYNGDEFKAAEFYHGGPNERLWGPKTRAYAQSVTAGRGGGSGASVTINGGVHVQSKNPEAFASQDLPNALRQRGLLVQAQRSVTP